MLVSGSVSRRSFTRANVICLAFVYLKAKTMRVSTSPLLKPLCALLALLFIVLLFGGCHFVRTSSTDQINATLFADDFSSGSSNWMPVSGAWLAEGGIYKHKEIGETYFVYNGVPLFNDDFSAPNLTITTTDTLLTDNFTEPDGPASQWTVKRGTFSVSNNTYYASSTNQSLSIPSKFDFSNWSDYKVTAKVKRNGIADAYGYSIFFFRLSMVDATYDNSYALVFRQTGLLDLYKRTNGNWPQKPLARVSIPKDNNWHDFVVLVVGPLIEVWFDKTENESPDIICFHDSYPTGTIGVGTNGWTSNFDDVWVQAVSTPLLSKSSNMVSIEATPSHLYTDSNKATTLTFSSSVNLDNLNVTVTNPLGISWILNNPAGSAGNKGFSVTFPTDFPGANTNIGGTYIISATNGGDPTALSSIVLLEVREKPLLTFIVISDTHIQSGDGGLDQMAHAVTDINSEKDFPMPDFVVLTGDLTDHGTLTELSALKTTLGSFSVPYYPIIGNHDTNSESGTERGHFWANTFGSDKFSYSWTSGSFLFLAMDVEAPYEGYGSNLNSDAHKTWLRSILNRNPNKRVFLFSHYALNAPRDSGAAKSLWQGEANSAPVRAILESYGKTLESHGKVVGQFAGHNHLFGASSVNGIFYFTTAGFVDSDDYRYVEVYSDRIESHILKKRSYHYNYNQGGNPWVGSTDSTHNVVTYTFGLPLERQFKLDFASKTADILDGVSLVRNRSWSDFTFKVDVTLGKEDHCGENIAGLVFRYVDSENYYSVLLDSAADRIILQKKRNGAARELTSTPTKIDLNTTYVVKVIAQGSSIKVYLNDVLKIDINDSTFSSGKVGLRTYRASTSFDNVAVENIAPQTSPVGKATRVLPRQQRTCAFEAGKVINLAAAKGHPPSIMGMSFANQALCLEYVVKNRGKLEPKVYQVPKTVDEQTALLKLKSMGIDIDSLTGEEKR